MIQLVSGEYPPEIGGVGDYTARLRAALASCGRRTEVVTRRQVGHWDARSLVYFVRHTPPEGIVHIQYQAGAYDLLGDICLLPLLLHVARSHVRTVTTFHDVRVPYLFPKASRLRPGALRLLARASHAVIAADARDLRLLGGPSPRFFHVPIGPNVECAPPDGYDRPALRASLGLDAQDLAVVYFGLFNASKRVDLVLETFERVRADRPRTRLLLVGGEVGASDPTDRLTAARIGQKIERLGESVARTGWLAPRELSAYLLAGDVALLPYADGASARRGSLLACAAHGLPIVSSEPVGVEVAPYVRAAPGEAPLLAEAVLQVSDDRARWQTASQVLASEMNWSRIAATHVELYDRLLRQTAP